MRPAGFSHSLSWVPTRADLKRRKGANERRDAAADRNHTGGRDSLPHHPVRHRQTHRHTGRTWDQRRRHRGVSQGGDDRDLDYPGLDPRAAAAQVLSTAPGSRIAGALSFTRALAREVGQDTINVDAIAPGAFPTDAEKIHPEP